MPGPFENRLDNPAIRRRRKLAEVKASREAAFSSPAPVKATSINANLRGSGFVSSGPEKVVKAALDWENLKGGVQDPLGTAKGAFKIGLMANPVNVALSGYKSLYDNPTNPKAALAQLLSPYTSKEGQQAMAVSGVLPMGRIENLAAKGTREAATYGLKAIDDIIEEPLSMGQEKALREVLGGVEPTDVEELRKIDVELKPVQATYTDMRSLFDPTDVEFDYKMFTEKYPGGVVELPRSDLEGFLKDPVKGFDEAVGRYYGPKRGTEELEEKVPVRIVEWTPESQYAALSRHGQVGGPRQKQITGAMRKLYGKLGYPTARRESTLNAIRRSQLDSYNEAELQRIYGSDTSRYKAVEIDPETGDPKWYRSSHADHLVARKRIERRVNDIVNSVSKGSSPAEKQKAKDLAEAYYAFQNMSTNFISLHGLENVRKSDLETGAWLNDIISKPYNKLPEDKKPIKAAYESALEDLRSRVGDKEFKTFMSKY